MPTRAPRATSAEEEAFHALCAYTMSRGDAEFIHQHAVDAFAAQHADESTKPIKITFALVGLFLLNERQVSGKQVQRIHMQMGRQKHVWPTFDLPQDRGSIGVSDVLAASEGLERDAAIHAWCASVWRACSANRDVVADLLRAHHII